MTRVLMRIEFLLLAPYLWALGRSDSLEVVVGDWAWILAGGLLAASAVCLLVMRKRVWARAGSSGAGATQPEAANRLLPGWGRTPRWPDGRRFVVRDSVVTVAAFGAVSTACAAFWLLGEAGIPRVDVSPYGVSLVPLLQLATPVVLLVWLIRMQVVRAVVEGWVDDDTELGFAERRIAALAAGASRARARFAPRL